MTGSRIRYCRGHRARLEPFSFIACRALAGAGKWGCVLKTRRRVSEYLRGLRSGQVRLLPLGIMSAVALVSLAASVLPRVQYASPPLVRSSAHARFPVYDATLAASITMRAAPNCPASLPTSSTTKFTFGSYISSSVFPFSFFTIIFDKS